MHSDPSCILEILPEGPSDRHMKIVGQAKPDTIAIALYRLDGVCGCPP